MQYAGLQYADHTALAKNVQYGDSSAWAPVAAQKASFTVVDSLSAATLAQVTGTPPYSPAAATVYVYGIAKSNSTFAVQAKLLNDAPIVPTMQP